MREEGMQKLVTASLLLFVLLTLTNQAFATTLNCKFKDAAIHGIKTIQISEESLILDQIKEIPLSKSDVRCGNFGRQSRFDGNALGYQVVLKSCSTEAKLEGVLVDEINFVAVDLLCNVAKPSAPTANQ